MKTVQVEHTGGPEVLQMVDVTGLEPPGPGQALVRIVASGVNFMDVGQRRGTYPIQLPFTPGVEGAGVVEIVGDGVTWVHPSDRVAFAGQPGAYAEASLVHADRLIPLPDDFSFEQGAAFPLQGMTAHYLIHEFRKPKPGDVVLVHAAAGGVGLFLIQWAHHLGAEVIGTVSNDEKAEVAHESGADHLVLYTRQNFAEEVKRLTKGHGADIIFDSVGRSTFKADLEAAAVRGHIIIFGSSSGPADAVVPNSLMPKSLSISGGSLQNFVGTREEMLRRANDVMKGMREGWLKVHVSEVLPLSEAAEAHRLLEHRETVGKLVLKSATR